MDRRLVGKTPPRMPAEGTGRPAVVPAGTAAGGRAMIRLRARG